MFNSKVVLWESYWLIRFQTMWLSLFLVVKLISFCRRPIMRNYRLSTCIFSLDYFLLWALDTLLLKALIDSVVTNWWADGVRWTPWNIHDLPSLHLICCINQLSNVSGKLSNACGLVGILLLFGDNLVDFNHRGTYATLILWLELSQVLGWYQFLHQGLLLMTYWLIQRQKWWFVQLVAASVSL